MNHIGGQIPFALTATLRDLTFHSGCPRENYDDVIEWKHFPRYWPFVQRIHHSPVNSPHKGQWRGALMFSLIWAWANSWVNNRDASDLRRHCAHYDVTAMWNLFQNVFITAMSAKGITCLKNNSMYQIYADHVLNFRLCHCFSANWADHKAR